MTMNLIRRLALTGAILVGLSACGGNSSGTTTPTLPTINEASAGAASVATTTTLPVDPEEAFQEYATCMREHGVDMSDPTSGGGVIEIGGDASDLEAMQEAGEACDPILEGAFGEFEMSPEQEAEMRDQELVFAKCMRANGVDWPDPSSDPGSNESVIELGDDVDPDAFSAAMDACSEEAFGEGGMMIGGIGETTP